MADKYKAIISIPGWSSAMADGEEGEVNKITTANLAYTYVPLIFRAVRIRCNALTAAPVVVEDIKSGKEVEYPFPSDPIDMLWKTEASLLLTSANWLEKIVRARSNKVTDLKWVNPTTMDRVEYKNGEYVFKQKNSSTTWTLDTMVYMREFALSDDIQPGVSSGRVALNDAALLRYMGRAVSKFFETGMMPVTLLQVEGLIDRDERDRIEGFFKRLVTGIGNIWRVLALRQNIEPKVISQPLKDMVIPDLYAQAKESVAHAFEFNPSYLDQSPNRATAIEHRLSLYQDTVEPRGRWICGQLNQQVFNQMGLRIRLNFNELDIYQEDESDRASSLMSIANAININPKAALFAMQNVLGYDLTDEALKEYERMFLSSNGERIDEQPQDKALLDDLEKWQRKAINLLEKGKNPSCDFASDHISTQMADGIKADLKNCKTVEDVRYAFASAGGTLGVKLLLHAVNREIESIKKGEKS